MHDASQKKPVRAPTASAPGAAQFQQCLDICTHKAPPPCHVAISPLVLPLWRCHRKSFAWLGGVWVPYNIRLKSDLVALLHARLKRPSRLIYFVVFHCVWSPVISAVQLGPDCFLLIMLRIWRPHRILDNVRLIHLTNFRGSFPLRRWVHCFFVQEKMQHRALLSDARVAWVQCINSERVRRNEALVIDVMRDLTLRNDTPALEYVASYALCVHKRRLRPK